ncbi:MAG: IclR family transcriptional regulator [Ramlibacter sp.]|nr:IclR family transcriptional regulator [Ramlibacter sp.]
MSERSENEPENARESRGIQSIEVGGQLLLALAHLGRPAPLKELAREAGMLGAKAHPYLVSFGKLGLIQQDGATGYYGLGPLALQLGLISLQQVDPIRLATAELPRLARATGHTVGVAIWGNRGPTFVRLEEGPTAVHVNMRHGTVVSIRNTASGRLFLAFMPQEQANAALAGANPPEDGWDSQLERELEQVRQQRFCSLVDGSVKGITALSAPVFDGFGKMVLAITAIGPNASLVAGVDSIAARQVALCAQDLSVSLGAKRWGGALGES